jgi:DNA-binding NarL/FixJ family response regulator
MKRIRVALADDHPIVRAGIRALVERESEMEFVGEAADGAATLKLVRTAAPEVLVVDVSMPGMSWLELMNRVKEESPTVKILILTVHEDRSYVQQMLQANGHGYLLKRSAAEELLRAIRAVAAGGIYLDPAVAGKLLSPAAARAKPALAAELSEREEEVLRLTAKGFSNKEAATRLNISIKTVETYKARACEKLGLRTRAEIVRCAAARGWLDGP